MSASSDVDTYINQFDGEVKDRLVQMRSIIRAEAPEAEEAISYGIIGYKLNGKPLVYVGGFKNHVSFYATSNGHEKFAKEFSKYKQGKGSAQFPLSEPLPFRLIKHVISYRKQQVQ